MNKYLMIFAIAALGALLAGVYMYNKPHQDMNNAKADLSIAAATLFQDFETDEAVAEQKYLDKIVNVEGVIQAIGKSEEGQLSLTLDAGNDMFGVVCQMDDLSDQSDHNFKVGEKVQLKGICTGKLMDVILVRCVKA